MIAGLCAFGFFCIGLSIYLIIRHIDENILLWLDKEDTPTTTKNFSIVEVVNYEQYVDCGEWKYSPQENIAICSKCGYEHYLGTYRQYATNYCPNCGQKMKPIN